MCYWMIEKRSGAAVKSTETGLMASGKTEKSTAAEKAAATAHRHFEEKAASALKGRFQGAIVKEREEEAVS